jgi:uncharacterized protein (TIGR00725 family)
MPARRAWRAPPGEARVHRIYVAVIGAGACDDTITAGAEEVGRGLGRAGAVLVCGGRGGVMEAACRGAKAEGGLTVGILPGEDRRQANAFVDVALPSGLGEARNALIARAADVVIAIAGEFGTLSEIALALKMGKPVIGLGTWELSKAGRPVEAILPARDPAEAVAIALRAARAAAPASRTES